jgi:hypothetical protein
MQEAVYGPILDALAGHQPGTLGEIERAVKDRGITFAQLIQAAMVLTGVGSLVAAQDDAVISEARTQTDKLNAFICDKARGSDDIGFLASPVSGGGVTASRVQQLFLLAKGQRKELPAECAQFAWRVLASQGQKIVKDGKAIESADENIAELAAQAQAFNDKHLPILKALGIA